MFILDTHYALYIQYLRVWIKYLPYFIVVILNAYFQSWNIKLNCYELYQTRHCVDMCLFLLGDTQK